MTTTGKLLIGGSIFLLGAAVIKGLQKASQLNSLTDKIKIGTILPRVHSVKNGKVVVKIDKLDVTNQSSLPIQLDQLFINIKNAGNDLITQTKPIQPTTIAAYGQTTISDIELEVPYTNLPAIMDFVKGTVNRKLDVNVLITSQGFEIPFSTTIDSSAIFSKAGSSITSIFN